MRQKLPNPPNHSTTTTRNCGVQVNGDIPNYNGRVINYAIVTQDQNDLNIPRMNGYNVSQVNNIPQVNGYNPSQLNPNHPHHHRSVDLDLELPSSKLKKSDSISSYTRYDDVDTDCDEFILNPDSHGDVLQSSHLDIPQNNHLDIPMTHNLDMSGTNDLDLPRASVRFSPHLDDRKRLSKKIPIFPIENEGLYCVVDIDRYKLNPDNLEGDRCLQAY